VARSCWHVDHKQHSEQAPVKPNRSMTSSALIIFSATQTFRIAGSTFVSDQIGALYIWIKLSGNLG